MGAHNRAFIGSSTKELAQGSAHAVSFCSAHRLITVWYSSVQKQSAARTAVTDAAPRMSKAVVTFWLI
jgi:hypothetical protein